MEEENNKQTPKMEIEINRYKHFVEAFNNPKMLAKAIVVLSIIIILVFLGISLIALVVKIYYPYNTVETNQYGATIIQSENNDVIYWLYNSADLWANSGIEVKAGDILSIKTSGAFHSSVHHLVRDANANKLSDAWLRPSGGYQSQNEKDKARSEFRIAPQYPFNAILMQVFPPIFKDLGNNWNTLDTNSWLIKDKNFWDYIDGGNLNRDRYTAANIYKIGEGQDNIEIQEDGILFFACNEIALTSRIIDSMNRKDLKDIKTDGKSIMDLGPSPEPDSDRTELDYYKRKHFIDAWFADNVGSFLIVIERKKR